MKTLRAFSFQLSIFSLLAALLVGCATWDGFSPGTQAALKAAAKLALSFGVSRLGESVHELKPYQDKLNGLIETTFAVPLPPEQIGAALKRGVVAQVPLKHRAAVLAEFKARLTSAAAAPGAERSYNARLASGL